MSLPYLKAPVPTIPVDAIFALARRFTEDPTPHKVDLGIGAYRDANGRPYLLNVVHEAEKRLLANAHPKEYLQSDGYAKFTALAVQLLYGPAAPLGRIARSQTLSGTGALRLAAEFLATFKGRDSPVYCSAPTWPNHMNIFAHAGYTNCRNAYRYFDAKTRGVDFEGLLEDVNQMPRGAIVVLQVAAHNPTGADLSKAQWGVLAKALRAREDIAVLMDSAYQGYASGDLEADATPVRIFMEQDLKFLVAQSFAKNMGLYGERVGCLSVVCPDEATVQAVGTQLKGLVRASYSNPPRHGAMIVTEILGNETLRAKWVTELQSMANRIRSMREALRRELEKLGTPGSWNHITDQIGMFSYLGLTPAQCTDLVENHHIYLTQQARISVAGLNEGNVARVARAMNDVILRTESKSKI